MAYRVEITARAEQDLDRLYRRINAADTRAAASWFDELQGAIFGLADNPAAHAFQKIGSYVISCMDAVVMFIA